MESWQVENYVPYFSELELNPCHFKGHFRKTQVDLFILELVDISGNILQGWYIYITLPIIDCDHVSWLKGLISQIIFSSLTEQTGRIIKPTGDGSLREEWSKCIYSLLYMRISFAVGYHKGSIMTFLFTDLFLKSEMFIFILW